MKLPFQLSAFTQQLLALCAQVDQAELPIVKQTRDTLVCHLLACKAPPEWIRLIRSDLAETLIGKVLVVIQQASQYQANPQEKFRRKFLTLHLEAALCQWLIDRAAGTEELAILESVRNRVLTATRV